MRASAPPTWSPQETVVWHDLECGAYRDDIPLWLELAAATPGGPVLDVGCGTGRVALELARAGHTVTGVDVEEALLGELARRARGLPVTAVRSDAREMDLHERGFALCIAPLQTVQLLGVPAGRARFLAAARAHLRSGGVLACAIVSDLRSYSLDAGRGGPAPEHVRVEGRLYVSHATAMRVEEHAIEVERRRMIIGEGGRRDLPEPAAVEILRLARVTPAQLEDEGLAAGFRVMPRRVLAERDGFLGSDIVLLAA